MEISPVNNACLKDILSLVCPVLWLTPFLPCIFSPSLRSVCVEQPIPKKTSVIMGSFWLSSIPGKSIKGAALNLTAEVGSIQIRNGSIMITCDGLYLVSLKGHIYLDLELKLTLLKTDKTTHTALWEETLQEHSSEVNFTTVLFLFDQDSITLWTSSNATIKDLSLSFTLQRPFTCLQEKMAYEMERVKYSLS